MFLDAQSTSGFEGGCCCYPDWSYSTQPTIVTEEVVQITGQTNSNTVSITGSV